MDTPTLVIAISLIILLCSFVFAKKAIPEPVRTGFLFSVLAPVYAVVTFLGEAWPGWGKNNTCYRFMGCNVGFFGYDAGEHFLFGVIFALLILLVCKKFPALSVRSEKVWKTVLIVIALTALAAVCWEIFECAYDTFSIQILHEHLINFRLHINLLLQSSNLDTMGDISMSLLGSICTLLGVRFACRQDLRA